MERVTQVVEGGIGDEDHAVEEDSSARGPQNRNTSVAGDAGRHRTARRWAAQAANRQRADMTTTIAVKISASRKAPRHAVRRPGPEF